MSETDDVAIDPEEKSDDDSAVQASSELDSALAAALGPADAPDEPGNAEGIETIAPESGSAVTEVQEDPDPVSEPAGEESAVFVEASSGGISWIPFACYLGLWIVLAGLSAYFLQGADSETPARWAPEYVPLLWSGITLTVVGPILSVAVWLVARVNRPKTLRSGLFASAMTRGALVAFFGVAIWLATLFALEYFAAGGTL